MNQEEKAFIIRAYDKAELVLVHIAGDSPRDDEGPTGKCSGVPEIWGDAQGIGVRAGAVGY